jgi:hypothetical protein
MVSSARIDMTANVFMVLMVDFECGQKRQPMAHFQDAPAELVGPSLRKRVRQRRLRRNFINKSRRIALKRAMPNDVGIVTMLGPY